MKGNPMTVTIVSFQDIEHMKKKTPMHLTLLRRKMLTFCEMRSHTWVVSAVRRDRMSPAQRYRTSDPHPVQRTRMERLTLSRAPYITRVSLVEKANFLPHQSSEEMVPESKV